MAQNHLHVTAQLYTATELVDLVQQFRQKPRESMPTWLLRLWDTGAGSVMVNGLEIPKLATMTVHPALRWRLYTGIQYDNENHSIIDCIMAACHIVWCINEIYHYIQGCGPPQSTFLITSVN